MKELTLRDNNPPETDKNRAATVDSCFVLIGTRQHGVAVLYETSDRASSNKMVLSMRFNVKMVLSIYIQLTLQDRNSMLCLLWP